MRKNIKKMFLLTTLVFLLVGLSTITASDVNDNQTNTHFKEKTENEVKELSSNTQNQPTIKSENKNQITKNKKTKAKKSDEPITTTLTIKFENNPEDEYSTEQYKTVHLNEEYTIDITLTEDQEETPIPATIQLYLQEDTQPINITLDQTGHTQQTYTSKNIGYSMIYAEFQGNEIYQATTSDNVILNTEQYYPTITINNIENPCYNSTITITGTLYNGELSLTDENLILSFNNDYITTVQTDNNGRYSYDFNLENIPLQEFAKITVEFKSENEEIADASNQIYISIEKIKNNIQINNIENNVVNNKINIKGNVTDENNKKYNGILKAIITNTDTGKEIYNNSTVLINDGNYSFNFTPRTAGNYNLTLTIPESQYHMENTITRVFIIKKATPTLLLEESYQSIVQENVSITGKLVDEYNQPINNTLITISSPTETLGKVTTDNNGLFYFTDYIFQETTAEEYIPLYFDIANSENIYALHGESKYYLSQRNVEISLATDSLIKINGTLHFRGQVTDAHNKTIKPMGTITLYIDDEKVKEDIDLTNGEYDSTYNIQDKYAGKESLYIKVYFIPNNPAIYSENYANTTLDHKRLDTNISIEVGKTKVGNTTIRVTLTDENKIKLDKNISITITDEDNHIIHTQNIQLKNGTSQLIFNPDKEGTYHINTIFDDEDNIYSSTIGMKNIKVTKTDTNMVLNDITGQIHVNDTIKITGKLTDEYHNPLTKKNIKIIINSMGSSQETVTSTNSHGEYEHIFKPLTAQQYSITSIFYENNEYHKSITSKTINPKKYDTRVIIHPISTPIKYNTSIHISGQVLHKESDTPVNGSVQISLNNKVIDTLQLENGKYQTQYQIKTTQNNRIQVKFINNNVFNESMETITLETTALNTIIRLNQVATTEINKTVTLEGVVVDENNNIVNGKLQVKLNNHLLFNNINTENGSFKFNIQTGLLGLNELNIIFTPNAAYYNKATLNTSFKVIRTNLRLTNLKQVNNQNKTFTISGKLENSNNISKCLKINVRLNDKLFPITTQPDGTFILTTDTLQPGNYNIGLNVNQTEYFNTFEENIGIFSIEKNTPVIKLDKMNVTFSEKSDIAGKITDKHNKSLQNQKVIIKINDREYQTITDNNGRYNVTIDNLQAGKNNLHITIPETRNTYKSSYNTTFNVNKANAKIILLPQKQIAPGETLKIQGQLLNQENKTLTKKTVTITVGDRQYNVTTNNKGIFTLHLANTYEGKYKVKISFEDNNHNPYTTITQFNIKKYGVKLVVDDIIARVGEYITFHATIIDQNGNPVNGGNLVFKLNGRTLRKDGRFDTNTTEVLKFNVKNGIVKCTIIADLYLRKGKNISASYSGSYKYQNTKSNTALASIQLRYANIKVTTSIRRVKHHENITFIAKVRDVTPKSVKNLLNKDTSIIFKINGVSIKDKQNHVIRTKVKNDTAKLTYTLPAMAGIGKNNLIRDYIVTAVYDNPYYYPLNNKNNTTFNVERSKVNINIREAKIHKNLLNIKASLTDYLGYHIKGYSKICIKINGVTYKVHNKTKYFTVKNGQINIKEVNIKGMKVKRLEIVTGQRLAYLPARQATTNIQY